MSLGKEQTRIAMRGKHYNDDSQIQEAAMQAGLDLIPSYADRTSVLFVDYGCGPGANSIEPMNKALASLPEGSTAHIIFEDTPFNDFSSLANTINDLVPATRKNVTVFPSMVPRGYYNRITPDQTVDLGMSWSSFNYLKSQPKLAIDATASPQEFVEARQKAFSAAAHGDLVEILKLRAAEVRQGGHLVIALGSQKPPNDPRPTDTGFVPLQTAMMKLVASGKLSLPEMMQFGLFPSHERSQEEIQAALDAPEIRDVWAAESVEPKLIVHPAWTKHQNNLKASTDEEEKRSSLREYAEAATRNLVSSGGWYWQQVLQEHRGASWKEGNEFLENLTQLAVEDWVEKFQDMKVEIWYTYLRLRRV